jgi:hypothetical protein
MAPFLKITMQRFDFDVEKIFENEKERLIKDGVPSAFPVAVLLGGQPACGKTRLADVAERKYSNTEFLKVNGDDYRKYHPEHLILLKDVAGYSEKTQIFSNVFTEKLIDEAIKNRYSIIVEGTMRNSEIPMMTAAKFRKAGFKTEAYVIAAPSFFTRIGLYNRYLNDLKAKGYGRLSNMRSHDFAVDGLIKSVNELYLNHAVDNLIIYTFLGKEQIKEYVLDNGRWNSDTLPGDTIVQARTNQLTNKKMLTETGNVLVQMKKTLLEIPPEIYDLISPDIRKLSEQYDILNVNVNKNRLCI